MLKIEAEIVYFEHCIQCSSHRWCTNHDEEKYKSYFNECRNAIASNCRGVNVVENQIPLGFNTKFIDISEPLRPGKSHFPRIGAFEVYFRGKLIYSKLQTGKWPSATRLAGMVKDLMEEKKQPVPKEKAFSIKKRRSQSTKRRRPVTDMKKKIRKKPKKAKKIRHLEEDSHLTSQNEEKQQEYAYKVDNFKINNKEFHEDSPKEGTLNFEEKPTIKDKSPKNNHFLLPQTTKPESSAKHDESHSSSSSGVFQPPQVPRGHHSFNGQLKQSSDESNSEYNEDFDAGEEEAHESPHQSSHSSSRKQSHESRHESDHESDQDSKHESDHEEYEQDYEQDYEQEDYEQDYEEEENKDEHPKREVTKSYNVDIPVGMPAKKKITYQNVNSNDSEFFILSSHPEFMAVKDEYVTIKRGMKEKFQLKFEPVDEPGERTYYLYIDRDGEPWECIQIKAEYQ
ncbi:unnamed protein product [Blepharisma stoltei]|uniref:NPHP4 Ig-like domain-containing protein n=1 Tax=Blepharisma stoltei TaxID=1481888 RepID=A0AAU9K834_9CILI|nr:unnamed protein product [Blepharisma stoltei]